MQPTRTSSGTTTLAWITVLALLAAGSVGCRKAEEAASGKEAPAPAEPVVTPLEECMSGLPTEPQPFCVKADSGNDCSRAVVLPDGFAPAPAADVSKMDWAFGDAGTGELCCGTVVVTTAPVTLYRAWADPAHELGAYWAIKHPPSAKDLYRFEEDICFAWKPELSTISACQLEAGSLAAIGPGQNVCCKSGSFFPESEYLQVAVNDKTNVSNCVRSPWTTAADADVATSG